MSKVVVLGTGVVAYGVIAECSAAGLEVVHLTTKPNDIASRSRLVSEKHIANLGSVSNDDPISVLLGNAKRWRGALLVPVNDPNVVLVSQHYDALAEHYSCAVQPWSIYQGIVNKNELYATAHEIGVPAPKIICPDERDNIEDIAASLTFPCIIKPFQTPDFFKAFGRKVHVANNPTELGQYYRLSRARALDVMISEIIPGPETSLITYVSCIDQRGETIAETFTAKVRETTEYGVASVMKSTEPVEELRQIAQRLLKHHRFRGFSGLEAKIDERDGKIKLIEINTRPVLYHRLFAATGINYSKCLFDILVEQSPPRFQLSEPGINWIHNVSEIFQYRRRRRSPSWDRHEFFKPYRERHVYALPLLSDPGPLLSLALRTANSLVRSKFQSRLTVPPVGAAQD